MNPRFLVIDDNPDNIIAITAQLRDCFPECDISEAISGMDGLALAQSKDPDVILLDILMPVMDGYETCRRIKGNPSTAGIPVVFLTALRESRESRLDALEAGADAFLSKPVDAVELSAQLRAMMKIRQANKASQNERQRLEILVSTRTRELEEENDTRRRREEDLRSALMATVRTMSVAIETRDPYTAGHQRRVAALAQRMATSMNLDSTRIEGLYLAAQIHDLGKISIPAEILGMPRKLTDIEFALMKTHSKAGYDIVKDIDFPWPIARIILEHHERIDGSGYPEGKHKDEILMESRILAVADCVEAIASHRPYRPALGIETALGEISANSGTLFDPEAVTACMALFRTQGFTFPD